MTTCHYLNCIEEGILKLKIGKDINLYCKEHFTVMRNLKRKKYKKGEVK